MENRLDQPARGPSCGAAWREGVRRLGSRLLCRVEAQPFDFDALAKDLAQGMSRRQALQRLGGALVGASLAALGVGTAFASTVDCGSYCKKYSSGQSAQRICTQSCENCQAAGGTVCGLAPGGGGLVNCVNLATDVNNCGACGNICPYGAYSTPVCSNGKCGIVCAAGYGNCDGIAATGCEVNLLTDVNHCGYCPIACTVPANSNATPVCGSGKCGYVCNSGFADCDGLASNGCETPLTTTTNCGGCGYTCNPGETCSAGACLCGTGPGCQAGETCNNGTCQCGSGSACAGGTLCINGACWSTCPNGGSCPQWWCSCSATVEGQDVCWGFGSGRCTKDADCVAGQVCLASGSCVWPC